MKATSVDISLTVSTCTCLFLYVKSTLVDIPLTVSTYGGKNMITQSTLVDIFLYSFNLLCNEMNALIYTSRHFPYSFNTA